MASVTKRGKRWWVRWREGGRGGVNRSITVASEREALKRKVEIEESIDRVGRYEPRRAGRSTPLSVILTDYVADCVRRLAPGSVRSYASHLELFRRWLGEEALAEHLSFQLLSNYHVVLCSPETGRHLHRRGPTTVHKHLQVIEGAWAWAWKRQARGTYSGVPQPDSLELKRQPAPHAMAPSWAQMDAMIAEADSWQRDLYVVLRCTGLRVQQAMGLDWSDIELQLGKVHIRGSLGKSAQEKRGRWIPLAPVLVEEISGWGRREGPLVRCNRKPGVREREARPRDAMRAWKRALVPEQVWKGSPHHSFRDGFCSGLKRLGADDEAVEFLVGHSSGIRGHYVEPDALPLAAAVALVPALCAPSGAKVTVHRR